MNRKEISCVALGFALSGVGLFIISTMIHVVEKDYSLTSLFTASTWWGFVCIAAAIVIFAISFSNFMDSKS